ncbi:carboxymuconolactone decarboxylase family protein [Fulvivirga ulvae]|uniref:carboxymuconolactone decarboxylase family protein n=1 Tax=Fulvivirga ulvae TaxID=2904245 RepID=UPI001F15CC8F|nr:carboxymuconolactone decarboxylase family protein [Fulvivirga ulvae]UII30701.1 carboxymuconolactone decarboxylase family protein [Fulvivirga ulvae]
MKERMDLDKAEPRIYKAMNEAEKQLSAFGLDTKLVHLVKLRVSQINGCGYCVNLHAMDTRKKGETEQRLFAVSAWWETPFFSEAERAALKLAEEVTQISDGGVSDETFQTALGHFGETGVAQLIFAATVTNSWNRLAISMHMVAE